MTEDRNSYSNIIKATSLFGGVKFFQILISIIRSKIVAILLGPYGMGISGLIFSTIGIIGNITGIGLRTSGVKDISQAYTSGNEKQKDTVITILRKLVFITGIIGTIITFSLSPYLSQWVFNSPDYSLAFKIVSIVVLINQINIGQKVLLQGTFNYKGIAKSTLFGSIFGLILTIPIYYIWGVKGIVPAIIITSIIQLSLSWFFARRIPYKKITIPTKQLFKEGKGMLTLGAVIMLTGLATQGSIFLLKIFISNFGTIADVGLYTAGMAIASMYVDMIFSAMGTDYTPRLAAIADNVKELISTINKQAILLITILTPLILVFLIFIKLIVIILYSSKFIEITEMLEWVMLGMLFRAISWTISFSFVARGDSKVFLKNEIVVALYSLTLYIGGYYFMRFKGLGIAFLINYILYTLHMYILAKKRFNFSFNKELFKIFLPQLVITVTYFILIQILGYNIYQIILGFLFLGIVTCISYLKLKTMINIKAVINKIKSRILNR